MSERSGAPREAWLDWLRILAFGWLVLYHVGMYYVNWDWHIKSPQAGTALEPWMRLSSPWRMHLIFLVSGAATALMLRGSGATGAVLGERTRRLLLPLVFGMLVVVPPQSFFEVIARHGFQGGYGEFLGLYLRGHGGFCTAPGRCLILPTWNHLWYLPYLFVYTLLTWLVLRRWPDLFDRASRALARRAGPFWLMLVPIVWLALTRGVLRERFGTTHALVDDWFMHAQYLPVFLAGAVLVRAPQAWERMQHWRWRALLAALAAWAGLLALPAPEAPLARGLAVALVSLQQWCAIVAALGFAHRHLRADGPWRRYLTDAVFPIYLLHQTLTIVLARALLPWALPPVLEGLILVAGTFGLGFAVFELVRRRRWLRPLFGLKPLTATAGVGRVAGA